MKITKPVLSELLIDALMKYIEQENLKPGDYIPSENDLATLFGISRTSVREGIIRLKSIGLLNNTGRLTLQTISINEFLKPKDSIQYQRFLKLTKDEMFELLEIRKLYECYAIEVALEINHKELLSNLTRLITLLESNIDNPEMFLEYDAEFHRQILIASKNSLLVKLYDFSLSFLYRIQLEETSHIAGAIQKAIVYHKDIVKAVERKDVEVAQRELKEHLEDMIQQFKGVNGMKAAK